MPAEIAGALDYVTTESPRCICEIGTGDGGTTLLLSRVVRSAETVIGIDVYVKNRPQLSLLHRPGQQLVLLNRSSYKPRTVRRVEGILKGRKLDVLFIDGDHRYEGVKRDFLMYRHLVRENGFILFHDIVPDANTRCGRRTTRFTGGVPTLWRELKEVYPHREFIQDREQDGMGIGVLRYASSSLDMPRTRADNHQA